MRAALPVLWLVHGIHVQAIEPARVSWGPLFVEPQLEMDVSFTDNLYRSGDAETDAWKLTTRPTVRTWLDNQGNIYGLDLELENGRYDADHPNEQPDFGVSGGDDDYTDYRVRAHIDHSFNNRNKLLGFAEYHATHEERGTGLLQGFRENPFDEPIEYDHTSFGLQYTYGNWYTRGRLELSYQDHEYEYQNFRDFTDTFDYDQQRVQGTLYWNISGRTAALLEGRYFETDYTLERGIIANSDSEEYQLLLGTEWQATAKTRGRFKLGYYDREFKDARRDESDGLSWDIGVNWRPRTYSSVDLATQRVSRETNNLGDFISSQEYSLGWTHDFSTRNRLVARALYAEDDYKGVRPEERERVDDRVELQLGYVRKMRRWLDVGIAYRYEKRDSTARLNDGQGFRDLDYQRNSITLELDISL